MTIISLRYDMDPRTGLPTLSAPDGTLTEEDRLALQREVSRHYDRLLAADGQVCRLRTATPLSPDGTFLVRVLRRGSRLPAVVLVPFSGPAAGAARGLPALIEGLRELVVAGWLLDGDEAARCFEAAVARLVELAQQRPNRLPLLLVAGYLALAGQGNPAAVHRLRLARNHLARLWNGGGVPGEVAR